MNPFARSVLIIVLVIALLVPPLLYFGMKISPISWHLLDRDNHESGLMLKGYDVVAYFNDDRALKGDPGKGLKWKDRIWYFSSDANKLMFKTFPEKYVPEYGAYCATAVSSGFTADIDPEIWYIEKGRLFLFFDEAARSDFIDQIKNGIIDKADLEWSNN